MKKVVYRFILGVLVVAGLAMTLDAAQATSVKKMTVADLVNYGENIVSGRIVSVTDGFDANNLPYTDVTIAIQESIKGTASGNYTFRQFGLTKPRDMGNGRTYVGL